MKIKSDDLIYILSKKAIITLSVYYITILFAGLLFSIYIILNLNNIIEGNLLNYTLIASMSACGMLCSIQYLKKIYKACLNKRVINNNQHLIKYGNLLYFFLRPIFAFVFVIITIFALLSGMVIVTNSIDYVLNNRFLYLCVIVSSFIGFSVGKVLDKFESFSNKKIDKVLD